MEIGGLREARQRRNNGRKNEKWKKEGYEKQGRGEIMGEKTKHGRKRVKRSKAEEK